MTLGEHLERVLRRLFDNREHARDVLERDLLVKEVAHGVHKHHAGFAPTQRLIERALVQRHAKTRATRSVPTIALVLRLTKALEPRS
jgi:hypothetical protein